MGPELRQFILQLKSGAASVISHGPATHCIRESGPEEAIGRDSADRRDSAGAAERMQHPAAALPPRLRRLFRCRSRNEGAPLVGDSDGVKVCRAYRLASMSGAFLGAIIIVIVVRCSS